MCSAKVDLPAVNDRKMASQLASRDRVHLTQIHQWQKPLLDSVAEAR